jgi:hypothetical protein
MHAPPEERNGRRPHGHPPHARHRKAVSLSRTSVALALHARDPAAENRAPASRAGGLFARGDPTSAQNRGYAAQRPPSLRATRPAVPRDDTARCHLRPPSLPRAISAVAASDTRRRRQPPIPLPATTPFVARSDTLRCRQRPPSFPATGPVVASNGVSHWCQRPTSLPPTAPIVASDHLARCHQRHPPLRPTTVLVVLHNPFFDSMTDPHRPPGFRPCAGDGLLFARG